MEDQKNKSEVIDLKLLIINITKKIKFKSKTIIIAFIIIMCLSTLYFLKTLYIPTYKATIVLKSKLVSANNFDQIIEVYNYGASNPELTRLDPKLYKTLKEIRFVKITAVQLVSKVGKTNTDEEGKFKLYKTSILFKSKPDIDKFEVQKDEILNDIRLRCINDNEIIENKKKLISNSLELDSLISLAYEAGNSYKNKIVSSNGQLMVMNNLYSGINELLTEKLNCQKEIAFHESNNIIFQSSPTIVSNSFEFSWLIYGLGIILWILVSIFIVMKEYIMGSND